MRIFIWGVQDKSLYDHNNPQHFHVMHFHVICYKLLSDAKNTHLKPPTLIWTGVKVICAAHFRVMFSYTSNDCVCVTTM